MRSFRIIIKIQIIFIGIFLILGINQDSLFAVCQDEHCLGPALQINLGSFQFVCDQIKIDLPLEVIQHNKEYRYFIKELGLQNGNAKELIEKVVTDYPEYKLAVDNLLAYELKTNYPKLGFCSMLMKSC
jgi:hypothetical protein